MELTVIDSKYDNEMYTYKSHNTHNAQFGMNGRLLHKTFMYAGQKVAYKSRKPQNTL